LFKVNFETAYDYVEWGYLNVGMAKTWFSHKRCRWIMECVSSASASVLVNGSSMEEFHLRRGVHQRDPLSPFMFLIDVEGLHII
jgi:hypothetical protein